MLEECTVCGKDQKECDHEQLKCACGKTLEVGGFGSLWCPVCEDKWEQPEGNDHPSYKMTITILK